MSFSPTLSLSPSFSTRSRNISLSLIFCSQNLHGLSFSSSLPLTMALNKFILCFIFEFKPNQSLDFDPNESKPPYSTTEPSQRQCKPPHMISAMDLQGYFEGFSVVCCWVLGMGSSTWSPGGSNEPPKPPPPPQYILVFFNFFLRPKIKI